MGTDILNHAGGWWGLVLALLLLLLVDRWASQYISFDLWGMEESLDAPPGVDEDFVIAIRLAAGLTALTLVIRLVSYLITGQ